MEDTISRPPMGLLDRAKITFQLPRFRKQAEEEALETHEQVCHLHVLCNSCKNFFKDSKLIQGSWLGVVPAIEDFKTHSSVDQMLEAISDGCHFCTLAWHVFAYSDKPPPEKVVMSQDEVRIKVELYPYQSFAGSALQVTVASEYLAYKPPGWRDLPEDKRLNCFERKLIASSSLRAHYAGLDKSAYHEKTPPCFPHQAHKYFSTSSKSHVSLSRFWISNCLEKHPLCQTVATKFTPTRLVNVGTHDGSVPVHIRLHDAKLQHVNYCCLSHCWGGASDILTLKTTNLEQFQAEIPVKELPQSFRDAITITRDLGQEYIWIDSLCILQDSAEDWAQESVTMGDNYEHAICTIAAARAADSHKGLFATRNPMIYSPCKIAGTLKDGLFVKRTPNPWEKMKEMIGDAPLFKRAWTFQERLLSPRTLLFGAREIFWICNQGYATENDPAGMGFWDYSWDPGTGTSEDVVKSTQIFGNGQLLTWKPSQRVNYNPEREALNRLLATAPNLPENSKELRDFHTQWFDLLSEYSECGLTMSKDKLVAVSGLAERIQKQTKYTYVAGLWRETILLDLLWYSYRRKPCSSSQYIAPTWSWASTPWKVGSNYKFFQYHNVSQLCPMARVLSIETSHHQSDIFKIGQVYDGQITVSGTLRDVPFASSSPKRFHPMVVSVSGGQAYEFGIFVDNRLVGYLVPDIELQEGFPLHLLSVFRNGGSVTHKRQRVYGLALARKEGHYERVGVFVMYHVMYHGAQPGFAPAEWFANANVQVIVIR